MTSYFIAGYSLFVGTNKQWSFFRTWDVSSEEDQSASDILANKVKELEESEHNNIYAGEGSTRTIRGDLVVTAFNRV